MPAYYTKYILLCVIGFWCMSDRTTLAKHCKATNTLKMKNVTIKDSTGKYLYWGCRIQVPDISK